MNNEPPRDSDGNTAAILWAKGGMWMLIWLGFGGCCMMSYHSSDQPLIQIVNEAPNHEN
jgi:hypothetical protein